MLILRTSRIALVATVALFFTLVAFGTIIDRGGNRPLVEHVLSMDTTFGDPASIWRAITDPDLHSLAFGVIIA